MQDLETLRRDKITAIINRAHAKLQGGLVNAGIDPAVARAIASARMYQVLPAPIKQRMLVVEIGIADRMDTLFQLVAVAGEDALKSLANE